MSWGHGRTAGWLWTRARSLTRRESGSPDPWSAGAGSGFGRSPTLGTQSSSSPHLLWDHLPPARVRGQGQRGPPTRHGRLTKLSL